MAYNNVDRIISLDILRGIALCGILLMNVQSFGLPAAAYGNPTAYGDLSGLNYWAWLLSHIFADQKFMSIFSMLFGVGLCIFVERAEAKGLDSTRLHKRRMLWLMLFGLMHAYLIWFGDILFTYAVCGFIAVSFRHASVKKLIILSAIFTSGTIVFYLTISWAIQYIPEADMADMMAEWRPTAEQLQVELDSFRGSWWQQFVASAPIAAIVQTFLLAVYSLWRVTGMMLLGIALYKSGVITAQKSKEFYWRMTLLCFGVGLALILYGVYQNQHHGFDMDYSMYFGSLFNYVGSVFMALAYVGLVMLLVLAARFARLKTMLAALGKTAFTNYILQSVICTLFFYGFGLGFYGKLDRFQLLLVVFLVWLVQLILAPLWLRHFKFGPLEWLWRCLTYKRWQEIRLTN